VRGAVSASIVKAEGGAVEEGDSSGETGSEFRRGRGPLLFTLFAMHYGGG